MQFASPWLAPEWAARIPFVLLLALTLQATWYGIHDLARSPGAQPVAFAFGGEAAPADYARAMADGDCWPCWPAWDWPSPPMKPHRTWCSCAALL